MNFYPANEPQKLILGREAFFLGTLAEGKEMLVKENDPYRFALIDRITGFPRNLRTIFGCEGISRNRGYQFYEFRCVSGTSGYLIGSEGDRCSWLNASYHDAVLIYAEVDVELRTIKLRELVDVAKFESLNQFYILATPDEKASLLSCSTAWSIHGTCSRDRSQVIQFVELIGEFAVEDADAGDDDNVEDEDQIELVSRRPRHWELLQPTVLGEGDQAFLGVMGPNEAEMEPHVLHVLVVKKDGTKTSGAVPIPKELHGMFMTVVDGFHGNSVFVSVEHYTRHSCRIATYAIELETFVWKQAVPDFYSTTVPLLQFGEFHFRIGFSEVWSYKINNSPPSLRLIASSACNVSTWSAWEHKLFQARGAIVEGSLSFRIQKQKELVSRQRALHKRLWYPKDIKKHTRVVEEQRKIQEKAMAEYLNPPRLELSRVEAAMEKTNSN